MLAAGRDYFSTAWWVELFPGAVIITLALATATVGRHLLLSRGRARRDVVHGISFHVDAGECLAIVGESGSGKSVTARTLVGLTGDNSYVAADRLQLGDIDLRGLGDRRWRQIRGAEVGFVLQDALSSLDPLRPVGREIAETLRVHRRGTAARRRAQVIDLLRAVGVPEPEMRARQLPHQLSGGLRQRALIASAIALDPYVIIADEPTTALDVTVASQVLDVLASATGRGTALILISHDLAVVSRLAGRIAVIKDGIVVEHGPIARVLGSPVHPYTRMLIDAVPARHHRRARLTTTSPVIASPADAGETNPAPAGVPLVSARNLVKRYEGPDGLTRTVVDDVSFELRAGETLGVVGESGAGKSTVVRMMLALSRSVRHHLRRARLSARPVDPGTGARPLFPQHKLRQISRENAAADMGEIDYEQRRAARAALDAYRQRAGKLVVRPADDAVGDGHTTVCSAALGRPLSSLPRG